MYVLAVKGEFGVTGATRGLRQQVLGETRSMTPLEMQIQSCPVVACPPAGDAGDLARATIRIRKVLVYRWIRMKGQNLVRWQYPSRMEPVAEKWCLVAARLDCQADCHWRRCDSPLAGSIDILFAPLALVFSQPKWLSLPLIPVDLSLWLYSRYLAASRSACCILFWCSASSC